HTGYDAVIARRNHVRALPQDRNNLVHVVVVRGENRRARYLCCDIAAGDCVEPFHRYKNCENAMLLLEGFRGFHVAIDVLFEFSIYFRSGLVEIDGTVLAVFVRARCDARQILCNGSFYRPDKWMDWTKNEDWSFFVPAGFAQHFTRVGGRMGLESP